MPYLNAIEVESAILALSVTYPGQSEHIPLPNVTHEGRSTSALRIANGVLDNRPAMLFIGNQHAREWGSSDILVSFAADLLEAYNVRTGVSYGSKSYSASQVQNILNNRQVFIFPCVNPDGRNHSQNVSSMWRRNWNPVAGVDLNRNYDFMWDFKTYFSGSANVVVSDDPNDPQQTYHGSAPNSEP